MLGLLARAACRPNTGSGFHGPLFCKRHARHESCTARCVTATPTPPPTPPGPAPVQRIVKVRRDYNRWVARETLEDYALRYTPERFRRWSEWRVANTAFGVASFLVLEAVGATLLVQYGFLNAFWAIVATGLVICLAGVPISVYAARHGVDMDLLTRGAGFGYIGSTVTSLIYASFTFIFFALEAAVMAYALELALGIPPVWGYGLCALVVLPLVTHGISAISRFQVWTQPVWLLMMVAPYAAVLWYEPGAWQAFMHYGGEGGRGAGFDWHLFGAAMTVAAALITQMGEQADYLRFMPPARPGRRGRWWLGVLGGGIGWVLPGVLKMLGGAFLAWLALQHMVPAQRAVDPNQMYLAAYEYLLPYRWAVWATAVFVVVSQLKINVTNAYAGSLAWSNFFSRLTHSHPGRVVWVVFNTLIAFLLMEMDLFQVLAEVLALYANIAIAWIMTVVADLVINKPLGWSPRGIVFQRAYLYDVNPVGLGAMGLASVLSIAAHLGAMGPTAQAFSAGVAMATALLAAPALSWATRGRYYLARPPAPCAGTGGEACQGCGAQVSGPCQPVLRQCVVCGGAFEAPDTADCPAYQGCICSLCCTLDARCNDLCKPHARLSAQWLALLRRLLPARSQPYLEAGLAHFLWLMLMLAPVLAVVLGLLYRQELQGVLATFGQAGEGLAAVLRTGFVRAYVALLAVLALVAWWVALAHKSREVAQEESNRQTRLLMQEIASHRQTDEQLQRARALADQASQAKTRYISTISHELRTPLNSILGYAQLLQEDPGLPPRHGHATRVILRGGEHLLSLIEGTLDIARIESGKLTLQPQVLDLRAALHEVAGLFELQAQAKGLRFVFDEPEWWPRAVRADEKRLRQILINLLGNAVKFTARGEVRLRVRYRREMAVFEVEDTGPGIAAADLARVFEPFVRSSAQPVADAPGSGLGLTIAKMLTDLMGGEMTARSAPGQGTCFRCRLFLPEVYAEAQAAGLPQRAALAGVCGYAGARRTVLVVDNEEADRQLLVRWLEPLGFRVHTAMHGEDALAQLARGLRPDVVFMDLAMPGIDGWETLHRMQQLALQPRPVCAVVSANAFDKGLDNPVGLRADDFLVKPVRRQDLLHWMAGRLALAWVHGEAPGPNPDAQAPAAGGAPPVPPPDLDAEALGSLLELARLGYYRGFVKRLEALQALHPGWAPWLQHLQAEARAFRFEALTESLTESLQGLRLPPDPKKERDALE